MCAHLLEAKAGPILAGSHVVALLVALAALVTPRLANNVRADCIELFKITPVPVNPFFDRKGGIANVLGVLSKLDEV